MLKIGDKAPAFTLSSAEGKEISLSDFKGKSAVIFFYPKANTSG
jgi:thioredoxin-dependent peroxiredoxin